MRPRPTPLLGLSLAIALATSCAGAPESRELTPPALEQTTLHFAGTFLTGPEPGSVDPASLTPDKAFDVDCRLVYVEKLPQEALASLSARSVLVLDSRDANPLIAYTPFVKGARIGSGPDARRFLDEQVDTESTRSVELDGMHGIVAPGVTAAFSARSIATVEDVVEGASRRQLSVLLSTGADGSIGPIQVALLVQHLKPGADISPGVPGAVLSRQLVLVQDAPAPGGDPLVLIVPSPFPGTEGSGFVFTIRAALPSTDPQHAERVRTVADDLEATTAEAVRIAKALQVGDVDLQAMRNTIEALAVAREQRPALIFLTALAGGELSMDLALAQDDALLANWIKRLQEGLVDRQKQAGEVSSDELHWLVERSAWQATLELAIAGRLTPSLEGMLLRQAGEAARYPDLLLDVVHAATDQADLERRLIEQNREFLSDNDTSARTRAFDWLAGHGVDVQGYDPWAPRADRRAALEAAEAAASAKPAESGT